MDSIETEEVSLVEQRRPKLNFCAVLTALHQRRVLNMNNVKDICERGFV